MLNCGASFGTGTPASRASQFLGQIEPLLLAVGGIAYATIPDSVGVIHSCFARSGGTLRVIDASVTNCKAGETALDWNMKGAAGPKGDPGAVADAPRAQQVLHADVAARDPPELVDAVALQRRQVLDQEHAPVLAAGGDHRGPGPGRARLLVQRHQGGPGVVGQLGRPLQGGHAVAVHGVLVAQVEVPQRQHHHQQDGGRRGQRRQHAQAARLHGCDRLGERWSGGSRQRHQRGEQILGGHGRKQCVDREIEKFAAPVTLSPATPWRNGTATTCRPSPNG
jgi:hypothetical protein